MKLGQRKFN